MGDTFYCSFCGKSQHEVVKLIAGPSAFICDECTTFALQSSRTTAAIRSVTRC